mmetsp:Transcript_29591/g.49976  ORF Transcript_29591/g.49976 Transcript_29591/m.49976 type:complete len:339 (-) Transcript_29591:124-1140(-)
MRHGIVILCFIVIICLDHINALTICPVANCSKSFDISLYVTDEPIVVFERIFDALIDPTIGLHVLEMPVTYPANETTIMSAVQRLGMTVITQKDIDVKPFSPQYHFFLFMLKHYKGLPVPNAMGDIFNSYATDKNMLGHNYVNIYHRYLQPYRDKNIRYLELGSLHGASLYAFREYFPLAEVLVGVDQNTVELATLPGLDATLDDDKIFVEVGDQTDEKFLNEVNQRHGPFDVIIDDCSHLSDLTIQSFKILFPLLKDDGVYIVEDMAWHRNRDALDYFFALSRSLYRDRSSYGGDDITDPWKSAHKVNDPVEYSVDEVIFASSVVIIRKKVKHHWIS